MLSKHLELNYMSRQTLTQAVLLQLFLLFYKYIGFNLHFCYDCSSQHVLAVAPPLLVVLVTGATGYIATHIIKVLQEVGGYRIRATARNAENNKKLDALKSALKNYGDLPEFLSADLLKPETWKRSDTSSFAQCYWILLIL